jgi:acyl dehydratase
MTDIRYFEDYQVGEAAEFGAYEVTEQEVLDYARRFDPQPFHVDPEAAKRSMFGGIIASGWHTGAMMMRMFCEHGHVGGPTLASPGFDDLKWLKPVRPGDRLSVRQTVKEVVPSKSRPDRGLVKFDTTVLNQAGEAVMTVTTMVFIRRRTEAA